MSRKIKKKIKALVVIPVLNEEKNLMLILKKIPGQIAGVLIDILIIDDGSTDRSGYIAKLNGCKIIEHKTRLGYGQSVIDGLSYAKNHNYDYVVKMDGDGQHEVDYLGTMIKILKRGGVDYIISSRYMRKIDRLSKPPLDRNLVNVMMTASINKITRRNLSDVFCGFFALTVPLIKKLKLRTKNYGLELEMILKAHFSGADILEIPHPLIYTKGSSKFTHVFGRKHNLGLRLELYTQIILDTLHELNIKEI